jgi:hypothetical protein|tara:strand:+ start:159 stop:419 length:261 start_codon:yes stop_codon:yes gene_type:complete
MVRISRTGWSTCVAAAVAVSRSCGSDVAAEAGTGVSDAMGAGAFGIWYVRDSLCSLPPPLSLSSLYSLPPSLSLSSLSLLDADVGF